MTRSLQDLWRLLNVRFVFLFVLATTAAIMANSQEPVVVESKARFTVLTPHCVRMEYSETGEFIDNPSLFAMHRKASSLFTSRVEEGKTILATPHFELRYRPNGKAFSAENLEVSIVNEGKNTRWVPGMANPNNLGGTLRTLDRIRGKVPLPDGLLSRDGWFVLDDSRRPIFSQDWIMRRPDNKGTDWYLFAYGNDLKAALKSLATVSGKVPLPRKYMLGSWYSRYWPYSSQEFRQIVAEYKEKDFPLDIMVLDMDWHKDGWTGWSWNRKLLPDAEDLLAWMHQQGLRVTLNVHPASGVGTHEDMYQAFMEDMGVDVKNVSGKLPVIPFDASDKKYLDTLFRHTHLPLEKAGVDFWWLDWQQYEFTRGNPDLKNLEWLNHYYFQHSSSDSMRGISFSRWGGWGDHRYPIHFSGDALSTWPMLEFEVPFTTTAGNVGCFFWSHDIGGHYGGITPETNARWVQFGAFTAALRLHSTRDKNMDKRPWLGEERFTRCMRIAFHLRSRLFPYIYSSARRSCEDSVPLTSPMYIEYPQLEIAYNCPQQYLFGDAFLVAPIVSPGTGENLVSSQRVWFPAGVWYDYFSGERYEESHDLQNVWADIYEMPLYVKGAVPIPMQPYTQRMASEPLRQLVVRTYPGIPGSQGSFTLYEDDGVSQSYAKGEFALTSLQYQRKENVHEVCVKGTQGNYQGQLATRSYIFEFPGTQAAEKVLVNGREVKAEYDSEGFVNRIPVSETSIRDSVTIQITALDADFSRIASIAQERRRLGMMGQSLSKRNLRQMLSHWKNETYSSRDAYNAMSFLSGIAIYPQDSRDIWVMKERNSPAASKCQIAVIDAVNRKESVVQQEVVALLPGTSHRIHIAEDMQTAFGVSNIRTLKVQYEIEGEPYSTSVILEEKNSCIPEWNLVGPFDFDPKRNIAEQKYEPELLPEIHPANTYQGSGGVKVAWQRANADSDGVVDIRDQYNCEFRIVYALVYIQSEENQTVDFFISSDDGVEAWLNSQKIHSNHVFRPLSQRQDHVQAELHKGINAMLLKISQGEGGWSFQVEINSHSPLKVSPNPNAWK